MRLGLKSILEEVVLSMISSPIPYSSASSILHSGEHFIVSNVKVIVSHEYGGRGAVSAVCVREVRVAVHASVTVTRQTQVGTGTEHRPIAVNTDNTPYRNKMYQL